MSDVATANQESLNATHDEQVAPDPYTDTPDPTSSPSKTRQHPMIVLIMGPAGSGKSSLINAVCEEHADVAAPGSGPRTTKFRFHELRLADHLVRLVDSPGFDGSPSNSRRVLSKLVFYLMNFQHSPRRLSGIIYLHPEATPDHLRIGDINEYIDGIFNHGPGRSSLQQSPRSRRRGNHTTGRSTRTDPTEVIHERTQQLERALSEQETEVKSLRVQLEQTQLDYASLRSELQLKDNTEPSKLVRSLEVLNRSIEDFGRHVAEHIVDQRISHYTDDHTALKASNLSELKAMFHQSEGGFSLIMSPTGEGMQTEDFFDLAVRSIVCHRIHQDIFLPFHPNLANSPSNLFIQKLYGAIQKQEHPTIAFRWRANAFLGLCEDCNPEKVRKLIQQSTIESLNNLVSKFFDDQATVLLEAGLEEELEALVALAWNWNHTLKGDVVVLGDFQPTVFEHAVPFDNNQMADFEPNRKKALPNTALCTVGMGLKSFRPKTKGGPWEETVVYKARVGTEYIYG
ncbi:50S ribosome-binding GTPase [Ceratobasidium sp. AG-Ba]|nr:50S ribosome-binding GTPase [Ceratobasidium sp. AG-Ba]